MLALRPADDRGLANLGWLNSRHTFSFGHYYDPQFMGHGPLRVINEDRVKPGQGFLESISPSCRFSRIFLNIGVNRCSGHPQQGCKKNQVGIKFNSQFLAGSGNHIETCDLCKCP